MHRLFNIIAETPPPQSEAVVRATAASFGDPTSIVLCTMGLCVGIIWLFWFDGFGALRKAPTRRCHQRFVFWPLAILICWIVVLSIFEAIITVLEIGLITGMLIIAQKSFARGLKGFGVNGKTLVSDAPWAVINLLGIFPLILFGLWISFLVGRLFIGSDFSLEVHQTLDTLTDAGMGLKILVVIVSRFLSDIIAVALRQSMGSHRFHIRLFRDPASADAYSGPVYAVLRTRLCL
jgi:hypothetical protein